MPIKIVHGTDPTKLGAVGLATGLGQRADRQEELRVRDRLQREQIASRQQDRSIDLAIADQRFQQQAVLQQEISERQVRGAQLQERNLERRELRRAEDDIVERLPLEAQNKIYQLNATMVKIREDGSIRPDQKQGLIQGLQVQKRNLLMNTEPTRDQDATIQEQLTEAVVVFDRETGEFVPLGQGPVSDDAIFFSIKDGVPLAVRGVDTPKREEGGFGGIPGLKSSDALGLLKAVISQKDDLGEPLSEEEVTSRFEAHLDTMRQQLGLPSQTEVSPTSLGAPRGALAGLGQDLKDLTEADAAKKFTLSLARSGDDRTQGKQLLSVIQLRSDIIQLRSLPDVEAMAASLSSLMKSGAITEEDAKGLAPLLAQIAKQIKLGLFESATSLPRK